MRCEKCGGEVGVPHHGCTCPCHVFKASNLVARLRDLSRDLQESSFTSIRYNNHLHAKDAIEAADEIERLTRERDEWKRLYERARAAFATSSTDEENRLRAALEAFISACDTAPPGKLMGMISRACQQAKDALQPDEPTERAPEQVCRSRLPCDGLVEVAETDGHVILQCPRCGGCVNVQKERAYPQPDNS